MGYEAEQVAIESRFESQWAGRTPVAYPNVPFSKPNASPWVRLTVMSGSAFLAGIPRYFRHPGVIDIQVFVPEGVGSKDALLLADQAAAVFRVASFNGVVCRTPYVVPAGTNDGWYQVNVSVPFQRDEAL
jgi:hypothetical protein